MNIPAPHIEVPISCSSNQFQHLFCTSQVRIDLEAARAAASPSVSEHDLTDTSSIEGERTSLDHAQPTDKTPKAKITDFFEQVYKMHASFYMHTKKI